MLELFAYTIGLFALLFLIKWFFQAIVFVGLVIAKSIIIICIIFSTLYFLEKYVEEIDYEDKDTLKSIIGSIYSESLQLE